MFDSNPVELQLPSMFYARFHGLLLLIINGIAINEHAITINVHAITIYKNLKYKIRPKSPGLASLNKIFWACIDVAVDVASSVTAN